MPTLDERVAYLEGRFEQHSTTVTTLREDLRGDVQDLRRHVETLESRIDGLDSKISRQFTWIVGIQIATLIAIVGALLRIASP
jgi:hypothetical protein